MRKRSIVIIVALITTSLLAQNGSKNFIDQNFIQVTGVAEMEVVPDLIYLHISISEKDKKGKVSVEKEEAKMFKELEKINIDVTKNLSIISFSSTYIRYFFKKNDVEKIKEYELLLTDASQIAPVYKVLDNLAVSDVSIIKLDHSKISEFKQQTKVAAIVAARDKAALYTKAINQNIGRALYIEELNALVSQNNIILSNTTMRNEYSSKTLRNSISPIKLKKIHITAQVLTKFQLQ
jgi:uncharacterized protein YggE